MPSLKTTKAPRKYQRLIVDGNNNAFRYEKPPFTKFSTKAGRRTGVVYGFVVSMLAFRREYLRPKGAVIVCWDSKTNLRKGISASYKAGRDHSKHAHVFEQMDYLKEALPQLGLAVSLEAEGYEADDLGFTLAKSSPYYRSLCISEDHDWLQLIDASVDVWRPRSKKMATEPLPYSYEVYHSLRGDRSDHVPVADRTLTEGTAQGLASTYATVDEMYKAMGKQEGTPVPPGYVEIVNALIKHKRVILQNRDLVKLKNVPKTKQTVWLQESNPRKLQQNANRIFGEMEFGNSLRERWAKHVF